MWRGWTRAAAARVARLERRRGAASRAWALVVPASTLSDPSALAAAIEAHRTATRYVGPLVVTPEEAPDPETWALTYGPQAGHA